MYVPTHNFPYCRTQSMPSYHGQWIDLKCRINNRWNMAWGKGTFQSRNIKSITSFYDKHTHFNYRSAIDCCVSQIDWMKISRFKNKIKLSNEFPVLTTQWIESKPITLPVFVLFHYLSMTVPTVWTHPMWWRVESPYRELWLMSVNHWFGESGFLSAFLLRGTALFSGTLRWKIRNINSLFLAFEWFL